MEETEDLAKTEEKNVDIKVEPAESWEEYPQVDSESPVPSTLSSPETAPSVTPSRKNELLLQARSDRISWIQRVPLPYRKCESSPSICTDDPWKQDHCLALLRDSNAVQSLPSILDVLTSLYELDESTATDIAARIQALVGSFPCFILICKQAMLMDLLSPFFVIAGTSRTDTRGLQACD